MNFDEAVEVKNRFQNTLLELKNVEGVGIGFSDQNPESFTLRVYVSEGVDKEAIRQILSGVPFDILESGKFTRFAGEEDSFIPISFTEAQKLAEIHAEKLEKAAIDHGFELSSRFEARKAAQELREHLLEYIVQKYGIERE